MPSTPPTTAPPPPPPPPPPAQAAQPQPPAVAASGPPGAYMVELLIYNGYPFMDHWAYFVRSHASPDVGVKIHATGDVRNGFVFEVKCSHDLRTTEDVPTKRVSLQGVDGEYFDDAAISVGGEEKIDHLPACRFEESAYKVEVPGKSLNTVGEQSLPAGKKITQRNCQTWIVESAEQLVRDNIFGPEVADYLRSIKQ